MSSKSNHKHNGKRRVPGRQRPAGNGSGKRPAIDIRVGVAAGQVKMQFSSTTADVSMSAETAANLAEALMNGVARAKQLQEERIAQLQEELKAFGAKLVAEPAQGPAVAPAESAAVPPGADEQPT